MSSLVSIPQPWNVDSLYELTNRDIDPELLATRFDADSVRVVPVFTDDAGTVWLDAALQIPVPGTTGKRPTRAECRAIIERTIPMRGGAWLARRSASSEPPQSWKANAHLHDLVLLPHRVHADGTIEPAHAGGREFLLDQVLGLRTSPTSRRTRCQPRLTC